MKNLLFLGGRSVLVRKLLLVGAVLVTVLMLGGQVVAQDERGTTEILWDTWGVPHIYAETNEGLFYAYGWAQMTNHADRILDLYGQSRGMAAELYGRDYLRQDIFVRILGIRTLAEEWYANMSPDFQRYVDAFAAGMTDYADANMDLIDPDLSVVLPITGLDVIGHTIFAAQLGFIASGAFNDIGNWEPGQSDSVTSALPEAEAYGSNTWAIAPSRSASGNAMLVQNPHLEWSGANTFFEAHLNSPDINIYGASLLGWPVIMIGFNETHGWSHTVNTHDGYDLYEIEITATGGYTYDGESMQGQVSFLQVPVRNEDGTVETVSQISANTVLGPLVAQSEDGTRALALRMVGLMSWNVYEQWWNMGRATSLEEFAAALEGVDLATQTIMYADRDGNIMHVFNGQIPVRDEGDFAFWRQILPGATSQYVWDFEFHTFDELPKVINPESGWLQNANEPPWTTTFPLAINYDDYPAYITPPPFMTFRSQSSASMLYNDDSITYDELLTYKHSTEMALATRILDDLLAAVRASEDEAANAAADVLEAWDGRADANSQGAVLFINWWDRYNAATDGQPFATDFDIDAEPFTTPDGLADPDAAVAALVEAAELVETNFGAIDVAYGDVYRLRVGDYEFPANGGTGREGEFRVVGFRQGDDGLWWSTRGDSYVGVIEFSDPVRAQVLVSYGNASQPGSPHVGDQLELFAQQQLRDAWLTREDIEANLAERVVFGE